MEEDLLKKTYDEVAALKDLFLRRLVDDKIKAATIVHLKENNEALQRQLDEKAISSLVREILLICDRIDAQESADDLTISIEEELLEILSRRGINVMPHAEIFNPAYHNAVGTVEETSEFPEKSIVRIVRNGYFFRDSVFRSADVIVSIRKRDSGVPE